jgi:hypothetical protein
MSQRVWACRGKWCAVAFMVTASMLVGVASATAVKNGPHKKGSSSSSWSVMKSAPIPASEEGNTSLNAVSCPDATDCEAVGTTTDDYGAGSPQVFVEQLIGSRWSITNAPSAGLGGGDQFQGVSCVDASDCMAVGKSFPPQFSSLEGQPLAEWWNGSTWTVIPVNNVGGVGVIADSVLESVSCTAGTAGGPDACVAVGYVQGPDDALVETWNGSTWSVSVGPGSGDAEINGQLAAVSCAVQSQCMAVGALENGGMALDLNDGTWSLSTTPDPTGNDGNQMNDVSCPQVNDCVGFWWLTFNTVQNAVQRSITWNGSSWSVGKALATGSAPQINWLTCATASSCVAVGQRGINVVTRTLVKVENGNSTWSTTPSRNPSNDSYLEDVSCATTSFCVAVGNTGNGGVLVESGPA